MIRSALLLLVLAAAAHAETLAQRVMENIKLSIARLDTVVGEARFSYAQPGRKAATHRVAFWFRKPFQLAIRETTESFHFAHHDGRVTLFYPREHDVLEFNTADSDVGVVRRMLALLELQNFSSGFGLAELSAHFTVSVREHPTTYETEIVPFANGAWRRMLGLHRILVQLSRTTYLPARVQVYHRLPPAPPALAFDMELSGLLTNVPVPDDRFRIDPPPNANRLGTAHLLHFFMGSSLKDGRELLQGAADEITDRIRKLSKNPWDF